LSQVVPVFCFAAMFSIILTDKTTVIIFHSSSTAKVYPYPSASSWNYFAEKKAASFI